MNLDTRVPSRRTLLTGLGAAATVGALDAHALPASAAATPRDTPRTVEEDADAQLSKGAGIAIGFDESICIHARFCVLWEPKVFIAGGSPWLNADGDVAERTAAVIQNCPSGALQFSRRDGGLEERPPLVNIVYVRENGPLAFKASLVLGGRAIGYRSTLCRCGKSKNKPLCDRSHVAAKFEASGEPKTIESDNLKSRDGELKITPAKDGPLLVSGNLEICSGTGRTVKRGVDEALCRCGHSANKPFCDGSHRAAGFVAEGQG